MDSGNAIKRIIPARFSSGKRRRWSEFVLARVDKVIKRFRIADFEFRIEKEDNETNLDRLFGR